MQPSAIGAGDDCCDRSRSRSSRALWRRATRQAAPGAHDASPTGCDSRAHGVAVTAGGPEYGPPYDGRLLTDDRGLAASRLPDGRNGRSVAATLAAPVHRRSSASPRSYVNGIDARTLSRRRSSPIRRAGARARRPRCSSCSLNDRSPANRTPDWHLILFVADDRGWATPVVVNQQLALARAAGRESASSSPRGDALSLRVAPSILARDGRSDRGR
jgi:hypothetical protein